MQQYKTQRLILYWQFQIVDIAYQILDECYNFQDGGKLIHFNFKFLENLRPKRRCESGIVRIDR